MYYILIYLYNYIVVAATGFEPVHTNITGLESAPLDQLGQTAEILLINIISTLYF